MYRMTILYGTPTDPEAFRRYYYDTHIPIARRMKGLSPAGTCNGSIATLRRLANTCWWRSCTPSRPTR